MESALAIAEVHGIVARTPDGHFIAYTSEQWHTRRQEGRIEWPEKAARCYRADWDSTSRCSRVEAGFRQVPCGDVFGVAGKPGINVEGLVLVKPENVNILPLDHRFGTERPGIPAVPLLGHRVAIVRVHDAACGAGGVRCSTIQVM